MVSGSRSGKSRGVARRGFTFIELMVALALGVIVLAAAVGFVIREMRNLAGSEIRQSLSRNGRYIGVSLRHDVQRAGIEISSSNSFGTVAVWPGTNGDTLVVLHVPYIPDLAPPHAHPEPVHLGQTAAGPCHAKSAVPNRADRSAYVRTDIFGRARGGATRLLRARRPSGALGSSGGIAGGVEAGRQRRSSGQRRVRSLHPCNTGSSVARRSGSRSSIRDPMAAHYLASLSQHPSLAGLYSVDNR